MPMFVLSFKGLERRAFSKNPKILLLGEVCKINWKIYKRSEIIRAMMKNWEMGG